MIIYEALEFSLVKGKKPTWTKQFTNSSIVLLSFRRNMRQLDWISIYWVGRDWRLQLRFELLTENFFISIFGTMVKHLVVVVLLAVACAAMSQSTNRISGLGATNPLSLWNHPLRDNSNRIASLAEKNVRNFDIEWDFVWEEVCKKSGYWLE